ncbi:MAG: homoserine dehydrogenase [Candidatus Promineifilaceae bacterium]|nr:homoserine dehydrogenase [Candidatus Promineifilaceae bacterium]
MQTYRLALIGFGNVGQGLAKILRDNGEQLAQRYGVQLPIVAVTDLQKGSIFQPDGLDPALLIETVQRGDHLQQLPAAHHGWDALETINNCNADIILELSYTDLATGEPALTHMRAALQKGKHVVTTNKGPIALNYQQLSALARENQVQIGAEGTVMSGTPAIRMGLEQLAAAGITRIQGILNGTTNYILTQIEAGATYAEALSDAQERGYAEADPTGDVEGIDAAGKAVILANLIMNAPLTMDDVDCVGITALTADHIAQAKSAGERWKLIAAVDHTGDSIRATVRPVRLPLTHPLAAVNGATNAITYSTQLLGDVTLVGPGAGRIETGYALIEDILGILRST